MAPMQQYILHICWHIIIPIKYIFLSINKHVEDKNLHQMLFQNMNKQLIISAHNGPHAEIYFTYLIVLSHTFNQNSFLEY